MNLSRHIYAIAGLATVLTAASYGTGHYRANSQTQPVSVTNTGANPVPVTGNVGISGTPTMAISGTPNVNVSGTPNVKVSNDNASPVPVQVVNAAATQSLQFQFYLTINANEPAGEYTFYTVPANKTFVIDYVSVDGYIASGAKFYSTTINDEVIHLQDDGNDGTGFDWWSVSQPMNYRISAGTPATMQMERNGGYNFGAGSDVVVTGHLE